MLLSLLRSNQELLRDESTFGSLLIGVNYLVFEFFGYGSSDDLGPSLLKGCVGP